MGKAAGEFGAVQEDRERAVKGPPAADDGVGDGLVLRRELVLAGDQRESCPGRSPCCLLSAWPGSQRFARVSLAFARVGMERGDGAIATNTRQQLIIPVARRVGRLVVSASGPARFGGGSASPRTCAPRWILNGRRGHLDSP